MNKLYNKIMEKLEEFSVYAETQVINKGTSDIEGIECVELNTIKNILQDELNYENIINQNWNDISNNIPTMEECQRNDCRFIVADGNRTYFSYFDYIDKKFGEPKIDCFKEDKCVQYWMNLPKTPKLLFKN